MVNTCASAGHGVFVIATQLGCYSPKAATAHGNEWAWLRVNKTLSTKSGSGLEVATVIADCALHVHCPAHCSPPSTGGSGGVRVAPLLPPPTSHPTGRGQQDRSGQGRLFPSSQAWASEGRCRCQLVRDQGAAAHSSRLGVAGLLPPNLSWVGRAPGGRPYSCTWRPRGTSEDPGQGPTQWKRTRPRPPRTYHHLGHLRHDAPLYPPAPGKRRQHTPFRQRGLRVTSHARP